MTLSVSSQTSPVGSKLILDTECNATARSNVTGAAGLLYMVDIDNTGNSDNAVYVKIYDNASPTVGTTAPDMVYKVPVLQRRQFVIPEGIGFSYLSFAAVITGGTAGATGPTSAVIVRMVTT